MTADDFNDKNAACTIECEFSNFNHDEALKLRPYLLQGKVILRKELRLVEEEGKDRKIIKSEYHGYKAEPSDWWLSLEKIEDKLGTKPKWQEVVAEHGLPAYFGTEDGSCTKTSYRAGLERYLSENIVNYDEPILGETQALGLAQNLLSVLPEFYLLPAITDYADEIDRRSSTTVFRRLMAELSDRIMQSDARHGELLDALDRVHKLLNRTEGEEVVNRLESLGQVEDSLKEVMTKLMPSIAKVQLGVKLDPAKDIFSRGVTIKIDDGVMTDVLEKGNGMQRSVIFALLQMLINGARQVGAIAVRPIILAIEEPELYIHPQSQRLIFRVLREFSGITDDEDPANGTDQVIYTTHSPAFLEVWNYQRIALVRKNSPDVGTIVAQAERKALGDPNDRKVFKTLTCFGLKHNELFFAQDVVLVEGPEDEVGVIAAARKLGRIRELPDEIGLSIVVTGSKGEIPKFQKVLNAFGMSYGVLLEMDGKAEDHPQNRPILDELGTNRIARIDDKLEQFLGLQNHFEDQRHARKFFSEEGNVSAALMVLVQQLLPPLPA